MEDSDDKDTAIAYYEAGRAVVARNLALRVAWTTIDDTDGSPGHTELDDWWEQDEPPVDMDGYTTRLTMFVLAGPESVAFFLPASTERGTKPEVRARDPRLSLRRNSSAEADQEVRDLEREVRNRIAESAIWQAEIRAVAKALGTERWLDSVRLDEVRAAGRDRIDTSSPEMPAADSPRTARRANKVGFRHRRIFGTRFRH